MITPFACHGDNCREPLCGWRLAEPLFSPMPAMADNHGRAEGGTMPRLDDTAVEEGLRRLPGWERRGSQIVKSFMREDFAQAMVFVNEVAAAAEAAGHHPDIDIPVQPRRGWADRA
jgi:hypothetical protein